MVVGILGRVAAPVNTILTKALLRTAAGRITALLNTPGAVAVPIMPSVGIADIRVAITDSTKHPPSVLPKVPITVAAWFAAVTSTATTVTVAPQVPAPFIKALLHVEVVDGETGVLTGMLKGSFFALYGASRFARALEGGGASGRATAVCWRGSALAVVADLFVDGVVDSHCVCELFQCCGLGGCGCSAVEMYLASLRSFLRDASVGRVGWPGTE